MLSVHKNSNQTVLSIYICISFVYIPSLWSKHFNPVEFIIKQLVYTLFCFAWSLYCVLKITFHSLQSLSIIFKQLMLITRLALIGTSHTFVGVVVSLWISGEVIELVASARANSGSGGWCWPLGFDIHLQYLLFLTRHLARCYVYQQLSFVPLNCFEDYSLAAGSQDLRLGQLPLGTDAWSLMFAAWLSNLDAGFTVEILCSVAAGCIDEEALQENADWHVQHTN